MHRTGRGKVWTFPSIPASLIVSPDPVNSETSIRMYYCTVADLVLFQVSTWRLTQGEYSADDSVARPPLSVNANARS